ncbi:MAG: hypothetical protein Q9M26_03025 [Mariprofundales bacterium]|nr:hypothetical protein [Mariprofundales bacterium]
MTKMRWLVPLLLAGAVIITALGFVRYFNAYEAPGEHWAPASPITHQAARFTTDMGTPGDYHITVEKLASKFPLFFVEYQPPGMVLATTVHADDGLVRFDQQFADEGSYRVTVQQPAHRDHREVVNFTVQTPLAKYATDLAFFLALLLAGFFSGKRLRGLAMMLLVVGAINGMPTHAEAHNVANGDRALAIDNHRGDLTLQWLANTPPTGDANRAPLNWSLKLTHPSQGLAHIPFSLEIIHLESGQPVLTLEGSTDSNGTIPLHYSPPDGTDYQLLLRAVIDGKVQHLALDATANAIRPTPIRQWKSFSLLMVPVLLGMAWGWKRGC